MPAILKLTMPLAQRPAGHAISTEISITNVSSRSLWVNARMALNAEGDPVSFRDIWVSVLGPDKREIPFSCFVRIGPPEPSDYRILKPGESIRRTEVISDCYATDKPGTYRMVAFYKDGNPSPPSAPAGAVHLSRELQSDEASVEVAPNR